MTFAIKELQIQCHVFQYTMRTIPSTLTVEQLVNLPTR